jgi:hypothetical protein
MWLSTFTMTAGGRAGKVEVSVHLETSRTRSLVGAADLSPWAGDSHRRDRRARSD